jgi:CheY-like chemotaxis protein
MLQPLAFLSYTRKDDEFFGGYITGFRKMLENAVHVVSGEETFRILQDIEGIVIGEVWKKKLVDVINESSFFVPMLSPLFFNSTPCMEEVKEFLAHERALHRDDLILPVYFLSSAKLEKEEVRDKDPIAKELANRQMFDWRQKAKVPLQDPLAREAILELAGEIAVASERLKNLEVEPEASPLPLAGDHRHLVTDPRLGVGVGTNIKRQDLPPRRVLWVDDLPDNNIWERRALEPYGVRFTIAQNTDQAKQLLAKEDSFDAIISDLGRPGDRRAGFTLLKWLRGNPALAQTMPYFIYTSSSGARQRPAAGDPQPQGITSDPDALVEMVVAALT